MTLPPSSSSRRLEEKGSISKTAVQETSVSPERGNDEKEGEDDLRPMASFMPPANVECGGLSGLMSGRAWRNHIIWRAGVSLEL